jgi:hypothetical protein
VCPTSIGGGSCIVDLARRPIMDSRIHMHLAGARLQDSLRDADDRPRCPASIARAPAVGLATAWQRKRRALTPSRLSSGAVTHH